MYSIDELNKLCWKGAKQKINGEIVQESVKLVDCNEKKLQEFYDHCKVMLYNDDKSCPGRHMLLNIIADQRNKCGVELFLRTLEQKSLTRYSFMESIRQFLDLNRDTYNQLKAYNDKNKLGPVTVEFVASSCPDEFKSLPLDAVMDGCFDRLFEKV